MYPYNPAQRGYDRAPHNEQPGQASSTRDGSTLAVYDQADYVGAHPTHISSDASTLHMAHSAYMSAFSNAPRSHDADLADDTFVGAICQDHLQSSYEDKRALLSGANTLKNWNTAMVALASKDATVSMLRDRILHIRRLFSEWRMSSGITDPAGPHSTQMEIASLWNQAKSAHTLQDKKWINVLLLTFGHIPELWYVDLPEADRKGEGMVPEPFEAHSQYASQGIPFAPQQTTSTTSRTPAVISNTDNVHTTASQFLAERPTSYDSPTAIGESQAWRQGPPSQSAERLPSMPDTSLQSQFSYQPAHLELNAESVQDASMFSSHFRPSPSTDNLPRPSFNPFDLSALDVVLQSVGEDYLLPEMDDLGEAATLLQGKRGETNPAGHTAAASGSQTMARSAFIREHHTVRLSNNAVVKDLVQELGRWHEWYLEFEDNALFMGLPESSKFKAELDKMISVTNLLSILYVHLSGQYK